MTEADLIAWFAAHPFLRNMLLLTFGSVLAMAKADYAKFKADQKTDPAVVFRWRVAAWQYAQGIALGVAPFLVATITRVLGG